MTSAKDEADDLAAVAADAAQVALAYIRAMPPGQDRGDAAHDAGDQLRAIADDLSRVLHEEIRRDYEQDGGALRPLANRWRVSHTLAVKVTRGVKPGRRAAPAVPESPAPVAVAVVTSHLGALAGRERGGRPPRVRFITGDAETGTDPAAAAVRAVGDTTGLMIRAGRVLARGGGGEGSEMVWIACRPATSDTEIGVVDSPDLADVQWMGLGDILRYMRGALPAAVTEHLTRTLEG